jgi:Tfp pilus assembly protein PilO
MQITGENTMNFRKLPREKRHALILVVVLTLAAMGGLGFGLIKYQYATLDRLALKKVAAKSKLDQMRDAIKHINRLDTELAESRAALGVLEEDMASGDLFSWAINNLRRFKAGYKVEIPQFSPMSTPSEMTLLPSFPYRQASITVAGSAHYHDLGKFLADFENQFPHIRLMNLNLDLDATATEPETLSFRIDIVTLVKPNAT